MIDKSKHLEEIKQKGYSIGIVNQSPLELAKEFGKVVNQYQGEYIFNIKPDPLMEGYYVSTNKKKLFPHSEAYEFKVPPKYILLICNEPDRFGLGKNYLSDMYQFLSLLSNFEFDFITTQKYLFHANTGLQKKGFCQKCLAPIYDADKKIFRYSCNNMDYHSNDKHTQKILDKIAEYYKNNYHSFLLKRKEFVIIDNYRMLHSRTDFLDANRSIDRIWIN